jgi:hypothetical protein
VKVRELIEKLLERNDLDDEIIVEWFDKKHFIDDLGLVNIFSDSENVPSEDEFAKAWSEVVSQGQDELTYAITSQDTELAIADIIRETMEGETDA